MGKTVGGAVWLDPDKLKPYDFYQYWRNIDDADIIKCLKLLTFLPMEEISAYAGLEGQNLNRAKEKLAYEVTGIVHGKEAADKAEQAAKEIFSGSGAAANMPEVSFSTSEKGRPLLDLLTDAKIIPSRSEGRRLIQQKGIYLNDKAIENYNYVLDEGDIIDNAVIIRKGKKRYYRLFFAEG
jgi:tyrosyl-tRNA synthetase